MAKLVRLSGFVLVVSGLLVVSGCRHEEPNPSPELYEAAVATPPSKAPKTPKAMPARTRPVTPEVSDKVLTQVAATHSVCTAYTGKLEDVGPVVDRLGKLAESSQLKVVEKSGVRLEGRREKWRVCLPVAENKPPAVKLPGRYVARLSHKGDYGELLNRKPELLKWVRKQSRQVILGSPLVIVLFDDPATSDVSKRRSNLDIEVLQ